MKNLAVLLVGTAVWFLLCLVQSSYQDGHKSTNHSKLHDSRCADFMALINLGC